MVDGHGADTGEQEADEGVAPERDGIVVEDAEVGPARERFSVGGRPGPDHVVEDVEEELGLVTVGMAEGHDEPCAPLLEVAEGVDEFLHVEDLDPAELEDDAKVGGHEEAAEGDERLEGARGRQNMAQTCADDGFGDEVGFRSGHDEALLLKRARRCGTGVFGYAHLVTGNGGCQGERRKRPASATRTGQRSKIAVWRTASKLWRSASVAAWHAAAATLAPGTL